MAQSYAEFLAENGATADEIKVLDVPAARKAYDKQQSLVAAAAAERQKAADLIERNREWATQVETQNQSYLRERDTALADSAANTARLKKLQELGLLQVAENLEPGSTTPKPTETPAFDPKNYVDRETLMQVAEREGDAIATAQDIAAEHHALFGNDPAKRLSFRELRKEAVSRKIPVESLWIERYGVQAARDAKASADRAAHEKKIADEAVTRYKSEHPESNPLLGPQTISRTPFTGRVLSATANGEKQPWLKSDAERENARIAKVMPNLEKLGAVN
jgi:hypothetical protein